MSVLSSRTAPRILMALALVALLAVQVVPPGAASHPVQPGSQVSTTIGSCTLNFVFDGTGSLAGRTFIGTAAHCVRETGESASIGHHQVTVFYVGDVPNAVNGDGRGDNGYPGHQLDFALLEVTGLAVDPEVRGHPGMPAGRTESSQTLLGDRVLLSGYGFGFSTTQATREMRQGALIHDTSTSFNAAAPAISGDSGGPVLHQSGNALGIASTIGSNGLAGPTVSGVVNELAGLGIGIQLRTA